MDSLNSNMPRKILVLSRFEPFHNVVAQVFKLTKVRLAPMVFAKSLNELQHMADGQTFHAVVCDFALEDAQGIELLDRLEACFPGLRLLFICDLAQWEKELAEVDKRGHSFVGWNDFLESASTLASAILAARQEVCFAPLRVS